MQKSISAELQPINAWQAAEFAEHGVVKRDPMSVTLAALLVWIPPHTHTPHTHTHTHTHTRGFL